MKSIILFLFVFLVNISGANAQNNGFMGKKNFIAADIKLYMPMVYGLTTLKYDGSKLKTRDKNFAQRPNIIDYGINLTIGRAMTRNVGFMLQFATSRYDFMVLNDKFNLNWSGIATDFFYYDELLKANWLKAKTSTIMPIIEFTNSEGLLPLGLSHQFGFGITKNELVEDNYNLYITGYNVDPVILSDKIYNYSNKSINSYTFMYKINLRIPITNFLLYNVGIRYNLNIFPDFNQNYYNQFSNVPFLISEDAMRDYMKTKEQRNIMSLETGISLCF